MATGFDRFESSHVRKDGGTYEVETSVQYKPEQGAYLSAFLRDITARKRAEREIQASLAEKETLLRELHHRTNNNMGVIIALLDLQAEETGDEFLRSSFAATTNRIRSMALVYRKLSESRDLSRVDLGDYLGDLAAFLVSELPGPGLELTLECDLEHPHVLIDTAIPCGLVLDELVTNAATHAFPRGGRGRLELRLRTFEDGTLALRFADDGIGFPAGFDPRRDGRLGLMTVVNLTEAQLGGSVEFRAGGGLACELRFRDDRYKARI